LGKILCDSKQAKRALEIYNEQITYFSDKKLAFGALLCWYFIAEATIIASSTKEAIDIAQRALEIAQNPRINNIFFIVQLEMILAKANMKISDFESAKINLDTALAVSKKYGMNDLTSKVYLIYGRYYQDLGSFASQNQTEYLKGSKAMYDRALELVIKSTRSVYMKDMISQYTNSLAEYCDKNGINI
jgi:tetratricopeptide (TPR) repeat protein